MTQRISFILLVCLLGIYSNTSAQIKTPSVAGTSLTALASFQLALKGQEYIYHNVKSECTYRAIFSADGKNVTIYLGEALCGSTAGSCELGTTALFEEAKEVRASIIKNRKVYTFVFTPSSNADDKIAYLSVNHTIAASDGTKKTGYGILNRKK